MSLYTATRHAKKLARVSDNDCGVRNGLFLKILGHIIYILGRNLGWGFLVVCLYDGSILLLLTAQHTPLLNGETHN